MDLKVRGTKWPIRLWMSCVACASGTLFAEAPKSPSGAEMPAFAAETKTPVVLDGVLDEAVWKSAPSETQLTAMTNRPLPADDDRTTDIRFAFDKDFFYVAVTCKVREDLPAVTKTDEVRREGGGKWDNVLEIYLDPGRTMNNFTGIWLFPDGSNFGMSDFQHRDPPAGIRYASRIDGRVWTVELAFPAEGRTMAVGGQWGFNFIRYAAGAGILGMWRFMCDSFQSPGRFGRVMLGLPHEWFAVAVKRLADDLEGTERVLTGGAYDFRLIQARKDLDRLIRESRTVGLSDVQALLPAYAVLDAEVKRLKDAATLRTLVPVDASKLPVRPLVCPAPKAMSLDTAAWVRLDGSVPVSVSCAEAGAVDWVSRHWVSWFEKAVEPRQTEAASCPQGEGAYRLVVATNGISLAAERLSGVRYAMQTLRQLAIANRGTLTVDHYLAPCVVVGDRPGVAWRGLHFCWFPETTVSEVERFVRLAGAFKFNYVVLEPWGTFRSERFPWLGWKDGAMTKAEIRRLKGIADDLGVTLVPQVNVFGHASSSRGCTGKHATLDLARAYQPLFEPLMGWNWCLSNPETKRVLKEYLAEIHEAFGNPPFFHLGCDEASPPSCPECSQGSYADKVLGHIREMAASVEARGARAIIWHDMFLRARDPAYGMDNRNGSAEMAAKVSELPRSIVLAVWNYMEPYPDGDYPAHRYFRKLGFDILTCPWEHTGGIDAQGRFAQANPWCGFLGTTWHHLHGENVRPMLVHDAHAAWGGDPHPYCQPWHTRFMTVLRQVQWDMPVVDRTQTGVSRYQLDPFDAPRD